MNQPSRLLAILWVLAACASGSQQERPLSPDALPHFRSLPQRDALYLRVTPAGVNALRVHGIKNVLFGGSRGVDDNSLVADAFVGMLMDAAQGVAPSAQNGGIAPGLVDGTQPTWVSLTVDAPEAVRIRRYGLPSTDADLARGLLVSAVLPSRSPPQLEQALRPAWANQIGSVKHAAVRFVVLADGVRWDLYLEDRPELQRNVENDLADFIRREARAASHAPLRTTPALAAFLTSRDPLASYLPVDGLHSFFAGTQDRAGASDKGTLARFRSALEKSQLSWLLEPRSQELEDVSVLGDISPKNDFFVRVLATWTDLGAKVAAQTGKTESLPSFPPPDADTVLDFEASLGSTGFRPPVPRALAVFPPEKRGEILQRLRRSDDLAPLLLWLETPLSALDAWSTTAALPAHDMHKQGALRLRVLRADPDALDKSLPRGIAVLHTATRASAESIKAALQGKTGVGGALVRVRVTPDASGPGAELAVSFNIELKEWLDHAVRTQVEPGMRVTLGPAAGEVMHKYLGQRGGAWVDLAARGPTRFNMRLEKSTLEMELDLGRPGDKRALPSVPDFVPAQAPADAGLNDCRFELHERVRLALTPLVGGERPPDPAAAASLDSVLNLEPACVQSYPEVRADLDFLRARLLSVKQQLASLPPPSALPRAPSNRAPKPADTKRVCISLQPNQPQRGKPEALVTVVMVEDFQCPFCARLTRNLRELGLEKDPEVHEVWLNDPLPFHPRAEPAAEAALAAHAQGKFWAMHDALFDHPGALSDQELEEDARGLGLDVERYRRDVHARKFEKQIEREQNAASDLGITGTPTVFFNGRKVVGARSTEELRTVLEEEKARARKLLEQGVTRKQLPAKACEDEHVTSL